MGAPVAAVPERVMALGMLLLGLLPPPQAVITVVTANAKTDGCQGDECDESEVCDMIFL